MLLIVLLVLLITYLSFNISYSIASEKIHPVNMIVFHFVKILFNEIGPQKEIDSWWYCEGSKEFRVMEKLK